MTSPRFFALLRWFALVALVACGPVDPDADDPEVAQTGLGSDSDPRFDVNAAAASDTDESGIDAFDGFDATEAVEDAEEAEVVEDVEDAGAAEEAAEGAPSQPDVANESDVTEVGDAGGGAADTGDAGVETGAPTADVAVASDVAPSGDSEQDPGASSDVCAEAADASIDAPLEVADASMDTPELAPLFEEAAALSLPEGIVERAKGLRFGEGWGVAVGDYDSDGHLDVLTGGPDGAHLWRGDGAFGFEEVSSAFVGGPSAVMNVASADVDGDGSLDVLLTEAFLSSRDRGSATLMMNDGSGRFRADAGFSLPAHIRDPTGAAWGDYDQDGDLDLYLAGFYGGGLFRNDGGRLNHVDDPLTNSAGITCWQGTWADLDRDGDVDLFLHTDKGYTSGVPAMLLRNDGGTLVDVVADSGIGERLDGMGLALGDLNNDGFPEAVVTNTGPIGPGQVLYESSGPLAWTQRSSVWGLDVRRLVGWGTSLLDWDNDGDLDVIIAGELARSSGGPWLGENVGGRFVELARGSRVPASAAYGTAVADFDGDGRLDVVWGVQSNTHSARIYRNVSAVAGQWLGVELVGHPGNPTGVGATVQIEAGGRSWFRYVTSGSSYQSMDWSVVHFGLGDACIVDRISVTWPDGDVTTLVGPLEPGSVYEIHSPEDP